MNIHNLLEDIFPKNLLYAFTIRSPVANGFLKFIQYPKLPSNYRIITAANIPGENRLEDTSMPILADGKLSYIGEPVALLLGHEKNKLEELASQCNVIADEEPAVFSCEQAKDEPAAERQFQIGDPWDAFEKTGKIVANSYITGIQDHWYAEPAGAITWYEKVENESAAKSEGKSSASKNKKPQRVLVVKTASQWPYHIKRSVARALGKDQENVLVEPTALSLHMDGKLMLASLVACHAALGTFITERPVRMILNREEDFLYSPKRSKANIDIASTIDDKGNITATDIDISVNLGAYGIYGNEILDQVCLGALGFYNYENIKITARANSTNLPPQGPFSGFGLAQGFFAMERHVSQIADVVNQDPAQWRRERIYPHMILPSGSTFKNNSVIEDLIAKTTLMGDYYRKWASYELLRKSRKGKMFWHERKENPRGIGLALGFQGNGLLYQGEDKGIYTVEATLTKEGILEIRATISSSDDDYSIIWTRIASQIMSIDPGMVRIINMKAPDCGPSCASRNITTVTKLVEKCCLAVRKQRFHSPLPITVRRSVKPQSGSLCDGKFSAAPGKVMDISGFLKPGLAVAVVEVTIDLIECFPRIRGIWLGIDGGKIISENRARRHLSRSAVQALGWAFSENIEFADGVLPKSQFDNFAIPSPVDIPPIYIEFLQTENSDPKGIGELPFTCIPAAFMQAVSQAMDHCFRSIPLKRTDIWDMVRIRDTESSEQEAPK